MAGVLTRVLAHRTERDPESRESGYLPSFVNLQALLGRLSRICLSRMEEQGHVLFRFDVAPFSALLWCRAGRRPRQIPKGRA